MPPFSRLSAIVALATVAVVGPAAASIPPTYQILVVSSDSQARAVGDALVQYMSASGAFERQAPTTFYRSMFNGCLDDADFAACARPQIPATNHWRDPAPVVVRIEMGADGQMALTCVGSGAHREPTAEQSVNVDPRLAIFGEGESRTGQLRAAMSCIQSAALESSAP